MQKPHKWPFPSTLENFMDFLRYANKIMWKESSRNAQKYSVKHRISLRFYHIYKMNWRHSKTRSKFVQFRCHWYDIIKEISKYSFFTTIFPFRRMGCFKFTSVIKPQNVFGQQSLLCNTWILLWGSNIFYFFSFMIWSKFECKWRTQWDWLNHNKINRLKRQTNKNVCVQFHWKFISLPRT